MIAFVCWVIFAQRKAVMLRVAHSLGFIAISPSKKQVRYMLK